MGTENLHEQIAALRHAVEALGAGDAAAKARIQQLIADLERHLDNPADEEHRSSVTAAVPGLVEQFEVSHPQLTEVLNRVLVALSGMGI